MMQCAGMAQARQTGPHVGEAAALASAVTWASTSIVLSRLGARYAAPVLSASRLLLATPLAMLFMLIAGRGTAPVTPWAIGAMIASGVIGYGIGDTTYIRSMREIGLQRVAPTTTAAWVALSALGGVLLLHEAASWRLAVGSAGVVTGTYLIVAQAAAPLAASTTTRGWSTISSIAAIATVAGAWTIATLLVAGARGGLPSTAIAAIRLPAGGIAIAAITSTTAGGRTHWRALPRGRDLAATIGVATFGTGIGSWLYLYAVTTAGAARAVVLNSTAPLMALLLSVLLLHERVSWRVALGSLLCMGGALAVLTG